MIAPRGLDDKISVSRLCIQRAVASFYEINAFQLMRQTKKSHFDLFSQASMLRTAVANALQEQLVDRPR